MTPAAVSLPSSGPLAATRLYAGGVDGHPNGTGYRILAEAVAQRLSARVGG